MNLFFKYLVIVEFILFSGGVRFNAAYPAITMVVFVLTTLCFCIINHCFKKDVSQNNFKICAILIAWVVFTNFVTNHSAVNNRYLNYVMYAIGSVFAISTFNYKEFKEKYLKCFNTLMTLSILVFILSAVGVLSGKYTAMGGYELEMKWYLFNINDTQGHRLSGPYWEPGQLQIVIYYSLCLYFDEISELIHKPIKVLKRFGIIFLALILTQSTMAYITFLVFFLAVILTSISTRKTRLSLPIILFGAVWLSSYILDSSVISEKLSEDGDNSASYMIRQADNLALIQMTLDNPLFGTGVETNAYENLKISYDSETSSNGWLNASAMLGIPYLLFVIIIIYRNLYTRYKHFGFIITVVLFIVLIMCQSNEASVYFPYLYLYLYSFRDNSDKSFCIR